VTHRHGLKGFRESMHFAVVSGNVKLDHVPSAALFRNPEK
jgi:hypothetical protein